MNRVILMGRLTRDPDVRYTQGENSMCIARYTLAVDRRFSRNNSDGNNADFISCVAFGRSGEFAEKYFHKGIKIAVQGRLQTGSYTNKDGVRVYTTDVVVDDQEFAESKAADAQNRGSYSNSYGGGNNRSSFGRGNGGGGSNPADNSGSTANTAGSTAPEQNSSAIDGFMNIPDGIDEELPFT